MTEKILRLPELQDRLGLSRSTIYERLKNDDSFPKKISLGDRAIGFAESEVEAWIQLRISASHDLVV